MTTKATINISKGLTSSVNPGEVARIQQGRSQAAMREAMSPVEFKHGLLSLCAKPTRPQFIDDETVARHLAAKYIDADVITQSELSEMLRAALGKSQERQQS